MKRPLRVAGYVGLGLLIGFAIVALLLWALTRTEFGVERLGRVVTGRLEEDIAGDLRVGQITSEGLLEGVTVHDVEIDDQQGRPFIRVDSARLGYDWRTLLGGEIVFDEVVLFEPELAIEQLPGDTAWNYETLFPDPTPDQPDEDLILLERVSVVDGTVVVRYPWEPDEDDPAVEPADTARLILEQAPGGLVRTLRFEDLNAVVPRALWESPLEEGKLFQIASLSTRGYLYEQPFELRDLRGAVTVRDSLVAFEATHVQLPDSRASGIGRVITEDEQQYDIRIDMEEVAFADLQWLYPPLPDEGGGELVLQIQTRPEGTLWLATDAQLEAPGTELAGTFGLVTGDSLYFTRVDLRASPLNVALLEDVLPIDLPVAGLMVGTVEVEGPTSSLTTRGELRLASAGGGDPSAVRWSGTFDLRRPFAVRDLEAEVQDLDLALLSALNPALRLTGALSGRFSATGRLDRTLQFSGSVRHEAPGLPASSFEARGTFRTVGGRRTVDARLVAQPLSLDALGSTVASLVGDVDHGRANAEQPAAGARLEALSGAATGPIHIHGALDDLSIDAELDTPAGRLALETRVRTSGDEPHIRAEGETVSFRLDRIVAGLPPTTVTSRFTVDGTGSDLASTRGTLRLTVDSARVGALDVHEAEAALRVQDGLARIERFLLRTDVGRLALSGGLGLVPERSDSLHIELVADSLAALGPVLFPDTAPAADTRGNAQHIAGRLRLEAAVQGSVTEFRARGTAALEQLTTNNIAADGAMLRFSVRRPSTDDLSIRTTLEADSLLLHGQRLIRARVTADYDGRGGQVRLEAAGPNERTYRMAGRYLRDAGALELRLHELVLRAGPVRWALAHPAGLRWGDRGLRVDSLRLESQEGGGRIAVNGRLPWSAVPGAAADPQPRPAVDPRPGPVPDPHARPAVDFRIALERVRTGELFRIMQADSAVRGVLDGAVHVSGFAAAPVMNAEVSVTDVRYGSVQLDRIAAELHYADRRLDARVEGLRGTDRVLVGEGRIPIDLALAPVPERRLDEPLRFALDVDSLPASLPLAFLEGFGDIEGWLTGTVGLAGTTSDPSLVGELALRDGAATWGATGVRYSGVEGTLRLEDERTVAVDVGARTDDGRATVTGTVRFARLDDPILDLTLAADEFLGARRPDVELVASGDLRLAGTYQRPSISGTLQVDEGTLYLQELWRQHQVVDLESPFLFDVIDTTATSVRQVLPASNVFLRNLVIDSTTVEVDRGFWLRGRAVDAEVAGELQIAFDAAAEDLPLSLSGTLDVVRGTYQLQLSGLPARQFQIREGTVEFVGTPGIDPNLEITAFYRVRTTEGEPLDVRALVSGTLNTPRVQLASDAEPPISESDLASYVIFGRPTYLLTSGQAAALNSDGFGELVGSGILGFAATGLESFARNYSPFDYVAITPPPNATVDGADGAGDASSTPGTAGHFLLGTEVEVGRYWSDELFLGFRYRVGSSSPGVRLEWRFDPTWAVELFAEDRFAHAPSFGRQEILFQPVYGLFLFREWGY